MEDNGFQFSWEDSSEDELFFNSFEDALFDENEFMLSSPKMYQVMLLNDEETHVDFVLFILQKVFHYGVEEAEHIVSQIHNNEMAVCGTYTRDAAETKILMVSKYASRNNHPLKCVMQRELEHAIKES